MCKVLNISRNSYYYEAKPKKDETQLVADIILIFRRNPNNYGSRKIKIELLKLGKQVSRRRIGRIMKQEGLVSNYTIAQFKLSISKSNEDNIENVVSCHFDNQPLLDVVVSDLTYVRVGDESNYSCVLIDLFNHEIIDHSVGPKQR